MFVIIMFLILLRCCCCRCCCLFVYLPVSLFFNLLHQACHNVDAQLEKLCCRPTDVCVRTLPKRKPCINHLCILSDLRKRTRVCWCQWNFIVCLIGDGHMDFKQFIKINRNLIVTVLNGVHMLFKRQNTKTKNKKRRLSISQGRRKENGALLDLC